MYWRDYPGYQQFDASRERLFKKISDTNQLLQPLGKRLCLTITDRCFPDEFVNQRQQVLVTNSVMSPGMLDDARYEQLPASFYHLYYLYFGDTFEESHIEKDYNCFIARMDPVRQSWLYQLVRRNIFERGYISFKMDLSRHIQRGQCSSDATPAQVFEDQFEKYCKNFQAEHEQVRHLLPYRNFDDTAGLEHIVMKTKFSIILETYFEPHDPITFSEKIFRGLLFPRPWLLFSTKGSVGYLRSIGFDVLDDVVDHSYDQQDSFVQRQSIILDQAQRLCDLDMRPDVLQRLTQAARHNRNLVKGFNESWPQDLEVCITNAVKKLEAL
jgi:hypothetical protein